MKNRKSRLWLAAVMFPPDHKVLLENVHQDGEECGRPADLEQVGFGLVRRLAQL
jgi:hypothetical protein